MKQFAPIACSKHLGRNLGRGECDCRSLSAEELDERGFNHAAAAVRAYNTGKAYHVDITNGKGEYA